MIGKKAELKHVSSPKNIGPTVPMNSLNSCL